MEKVRSFPPAFPLFLDTLELFYLNIEGHFTGSQNDIVSKGEVLKADWWLITSQKDLACCPLKFRCIKENFLME